MAPPTFENLRAAPPKPAVLHGRVQKPSDSLPSFRNLRVQTTNSAAVLPRRITKASSKKSHGKTRTTKKGKGVLEKKATNGAFASFEGSLQCSECEEVILAIPDAGQAAINMALHVRAKHLRCAFCNLSLDTVELRKEHELLYHLKCSYCQKLSIGTAEDVVNDLTLHIRRKHPVSPMFIPAPLNEDVLSLHSNTAAVMAERLEQSRSRYFETEIPNEDEEEYTGGELDEEAETLDIIPLD